MAPDSFHALVVHQPTFPLQQHGDAWFTETFGVVVPKTVKASTDMDETLGDIATKRGRLGKKGVPDVLAMSRQIVMDWQRGKYQVITEVDLE